MVHEFLQHYVSFSVCLVLLLDLREGTAVVLRQRRGHVVKRASLIPELQSGFCHQFVPP